MNDTLVVNWFSIEILNTTGKRTYFNSFVTDLDVTAVIARGPAWRFFEHLRTVIVYVVFESRDHWLRSIEAATVRPHPGLFPIGVPQKLRDNSLGIGEFSQQTCDRRGHDRSGSIT